MTLQTLLTLSAVLLTERLFQGLTARMDMQEMSALIVAFVETDMRMLMVGGESRTGGKNVLRRTGQLESA
jgi:hypothetical protein